MLTTATDHPKAYNQTDRLDYSFPLPGDDFNAEDSPALQYVDTPEGAGFWLRTYATWYGCDPDLPGSIWVPLAQLMWGFHVEFIAGDVDNKAPGGKGTGFVITTKDTTRTPMVETDFTTSLMFPIWKTTKSGANDMPGQR